VDLALPARGVVGVYGHSGSGKTTLLRSLAGLEAEARGSVRLGDDVWQDGGTFLPPHRRRVGYVFQDADLFPHLTVEGNLRFAERRAADEGPGFGETVAWLGVGPLLARRPAGLSGGERQRVSLARALLSAPRLLLLDEPLSALDQVGRQAILPHFEELGDRLSIPVLYVSHSLEEVVRLSGTMVWLAEGRARALGPPSELLGRLDFARWRGDDAASVVDAVVEEHDERYELTLLRTAWGPLWVRRQPRPPGETVRVWIAASDVSLSLAPETATSVLNRFRLEVLEIEDVGAGQALVRLGDRESGAPPLLARITRLSRDRLELAPGGVVWAGVKSVAVVE
jgi:molybdate transport system ATP-binding protein